MIIMAQVNIENTLLFGLQNNLCLIVIDLPWKSTIFELNLES